MTDEKTDKTPLETMMEEWMSASTEFWTSFLKTAAAVPTLDETKNRYLESLEKTVSRWQSLAAAATDPQMSEAVLKGLGTMPDFFLKVSQAGWKASQRIHKQVRERVGKIGRKKEAYRFENIEQEVLKAWKEVYEEEFRPFFRVPQLGLTRYYQERFNALIDQLNVLQTTLSEFLYILYLPVERSFQVLQDEVDRMYKEGKLPEKPKDYYNLWVKILEGHYMTLFKSEEYLQALREMLVEVENFSRAKNQVMMDILQFLPVPTHKDMDELARDMYNLKKRVWELEKKLASRS
ncbi:MAG: hypothetical protein N2Z74_03925 [Syntrophales bacterium]|nr:hypothetical protein [Syntrophales bacterium]